MLPVDEVVDSPLFLSIAFAGVKLLRLMGWRGGRQIGPKHIAAASGKMMLWIELYLIFFCKYVVTLRCIIFVICAYKI